MKQIYYILVAVVLIVSVVGIYLYTQQPEDTWPPPHVVKLPESETWALDNELVILASGRDVESLVREFGGEITISVPETDTYQVKFPVSTLEELNAIADKLRKKESGIRVIYAFVMRPPEPGEPQ